MGYEVDILTNVSARLPFDLKEGQRIGDGGDIILLALTQR
jgi:hypothetical protein